MDNGQKAQNLDSTSFSMSSPDFIKEGAGDHTENPFQGAIEHDKRSLGGQAIFSSETMPDEENETTDGLGQIISLEQPAQDSKPADNSSKTPVFNQSAIRMDGDHLASSAIAEIKVAENKLSQTGDIADFYEEIRDMMELNVVNNFHRKQVA